MDMMDMMNMVSMMNKVIDNDNDDYDGGCDGADQEVVTSVSDGTEGPGHDSTWLRPISNGRRDRSSPGLSPPLTAAMLATTLRLDRHWQSWGGERGEERGAADKWESYKPTNSEPNPG